MHLPQKAGWMNGILYLEAQKPVYLPEDEFGDLNHDSAEIAIQSAIKSHPTEIDWHLANKVTRDRLGIPMAVGKAL